ncbi:MAG: hypothetical protein ACXWU2_09640 [Allosphingosinicella sp.]
MNGKSDIERADRISRRRAGLFIVLGIYMMAGQGVWPDGGEGLTRASDLKAAAWLAWAVLLLSALALGGGWLAGSRVRSLVEDEGTRANRRQAYATGFWTGCGAALLVYAITFLKPVGGREAIHVVLTVAVSGALISFATLERRALKDG